MECDQGTIGYRYFRKRHGTHIEVGFHFTIFHFSFFVKISFKYFFKLPPNVFRTLLLHCIREFRGDVKTRDFIWNLITPRGNFSNKNAKKASNSGGIFREAWAALPEYNPPAFAVDSSFQRHLHRHSNKLLSRVYQLQFLAKHFIGDRGAEIMESKKGHAEIEIENCPSINDPFVERWNSVCDKSFLIGIYKHGMENFEGIRSDEKLCFIEMDFKVI